MRATRAILLGASTAAVALQHEKILRYDNSQQHQQQSILAPAPAPAEADAAALLKIPPPLAPEEAIPPESTRCPPADDATPLTTTFVLVSSSRSSTSPPPPPPSPMAVAPALSLALPLNVTAAPPGQQEVAAADDAESNKDEGAAGPVAKASLFPLAIGLAAAVVML